MTVLSRTRTACLGLALSLAAPSFAAAQMPARTLSLQFDAEGRVTLSAAGVQIRDVLQEWARQCQCLIVNAQNLAGTLDVPVHFEHATQQTVLEALLRKAAGYALAPRRLGSAGPSDYETIYVLPTSSPTVAAAYTPPAASYVPIVPPPTPGSPETEIPPVTPIALPRDPNAPQTPEPAGTPPAAPRTPGVPSRFVPIVPVGPSAPPQAPSSATSRPPGTVTP